MNPCGLVLWSAAAVSVPRGIWRLKNGLGERGEGGRRGRARAQDQTAKIKPSTRSQGSPSEWVPQNEAEVRSRRSRPKSAPLWHDFSQHDSFAAHSRQFYADRSADTPARGSRTRDQSICRRVESPRCRQATQVENGRRRDHYLAMGKRKVEGDYTQYGWRPYWW